MRNGIICLLVLAAIVSTSFAADAEDDGALPAFTILSCVVACANSTPAKLLERPVYAFPKRELNRPDLYVEAFVQLRFTIGTDGHVHDVHVLNLAGPEYFAQTAMENVSAWTYQPATLDGHPVEQVHSLNFKYNVVIRAHGARDATAHAFDTAKSLVAAGKPDEAYTILAAEQAKPDLNFYERGMLALPMAYIAMTRKDYAGAREIVENPMILGAGELSTAVLQQLYRIRIEADLRLGDMVDAIGSLNGLQAIRNHDSTESLEKLVADMRIKIDAMPEIPSMARIPPSGERFFGLYRRTFRFMIDSGKLSKFTMVCKQQVISSPITETAQWHVPGNWGDCYLYVEGDPRTNFTIFQSAS